jgi:hypothetical protein
MHEIEMSFEDSCAVASGGLEGASRVRTAGWRWVHRALSIDEYVQLVEMWDLEPLIVAMTWDPLHAPHVEALREAMQRKTARMQ